MIINVFNNDTHRDDRFVYLTEDGFYFSLFFFDLCVWI
jgi:hypothetical protein